MAICKSIPEVSDEMSAGLQLAAGRLWRARAMIVLCAAAVDNDPVQKVLAEAEGILLEIANDLEAPENLVN